MTSPREPRVWRIAILAPCDWITDNARLHHMAKAKLVTQWRAATVAWAALGKLPTHAKPGSNPPDAVHVDAVARFLGRAPVNDRNNLRATLKAVVDGLGPPRGRNAGWRLIVDDNDKRVGRQEITIGDRLNPATSRPGHPGLLDITITEIIK